MALERAYPQGADVEEHLDKLVESVKAAFISNSASVGSITGGAVQISHSTQSLPATAEQYRAAHAIPPLPDNVYLELDSQDESRMYCAPEGDLKSTLLKSTSSNSVIAARGVEKPEVVHGASGSAGVGKTTALIALGHDRDVRDHFKDGALYMTFWR